MEHQETTAPNYEVDSPSIDYTEVRPATKPDTREGIGERWLRRLNSCLKRAQTSILKLQKPEGYWCFELEADCTIPSEYIMMMHFLAEIDETLQSKLATYIRNRQADHDGWPLYYGGKFNLSCSVKAYWALKFAGDDTDAPHMVRAREAILANGGAAQCNVFTRISLALFGEVPWRAVPFLPVEFLLLPSWAPVHLNKVSYWTRTVVTPLLILCSLKARAKNPLGISIRELFLSAPEKEQSYFPVRSKLNHALLAMERSAKTSIPPAMAMSSLTHRIPQIMGSSHSSK